MIIALENCYQVSVLEARWHGWESAPKINELKYLDAAAQCENYIASFAIQMCAIKFLILFRRQKWLVFNIRTLFRTIRSSKIALKSNISDFHTVCHRRDLANRVSPFSSAKPLFVFKWCKSKTLHHVACLTPNYEPTPKLPSKSLIPFRIPICQFYLDCQEWLRYMTL